MARKCDCGHCGNCRANRRYDKHKERLAKERAVKREKPKFKLAVRYEWDRT
jgi:hypothetical protein